MTQCEMILDYMQQGHSITPLDALGKFGCFRLDSRISELRERGVAIEVKKVTYTNGSGVKKSIASYSIKREEEQ